MSGFDYVAGLDGWRLRPKGFSVERHVVIEVDNLLLAVLVPNDDLVRGNGFDLAPELCLDRSQFLAHLVFMGHSGHVRFFGLHKWSFGIGEGKGLRKHPGTHDDTLTLDHAFHRHHVCQGREGAVHVRHGVVHVLLGNVFNLAVHESRHHGKIRLLFAGEHQRHVGQFLRRLVLCFAGLGVFHRHHEGVQVLGGFTGTGGKPHVDAHLAAFRRAEIVDKAKMTRLHAPGFGRDGVEGADATFAQSCDASLMVEDFCRVDFFKAGAEARTNQSRRDRLVKHTRRNVVERLLGRGFPEQLP